MITCKSTAVNTRVNPKLTISTLIVHRCCHAAHGFQICIKSRCDSNDTDDDPFQAFRSLICHVLTALQQCSAENISGSLQPENY